MRFLWMLRRVVCLSFLLLVVRVAMSLLGVKFLSFMVSIVEAVAGGWCVNVWVVLGVVALQCGKRTQPFTEELGVYGLVLESVSPMLSECRGDLFRRSGMFSRREMDDAK